MVRFLGKLLRQNNNQEEFRRKHFDTYKKFNFVTLSCFSFFLAKNEEGDAKKYNTEFLVCRANYFHYH